MWTAGEMPGLRLFEGEEGDIQPGLWERIRSLFTSPIQPEFEGDILDPDGGGYDDLSGSGWTGEERGLEDEDLEDLGEVLAIVGIGALVVGLLWLRGTWVRWAEERRRREEGVGRDRGGLGGVAVQHGGEEVIPEPLIGAPIP